MFVPETSPVVCPYCHHVFPVRSREIQIDESAEIKKIEGFHFNIKPASVCNSYTELLEYAKAHNYKPGWAWYQAKERGFL